MNESGNWIVFFFKEKITLKRKKMFGHPTWEPTFKHFEKIVFLNKFCIIFHFLSIFAKDSFKFFKGSLLQILLGPFLNILSHMAVHVVLLTYKFSTVLSFERHMRTTKHYRSHIVWLKLMLYINCMAENFISILTRFSF